MDTKKRIRKEILAKRDALTITEQKQKSKFISECITHMKEFQDSDIYLLFASHKSEVDTDEIFHTALLTGKPVYFPKVMGEEMEFYQINSVEDLKAGYRGIREPKADWSKRFVSRQDKKVFVLMPGTAFDTDGGRIGYGGGFYDKFLMRLEKKMKSENLCKTAVSFACQIVESGRIVRKEYDIAPDYLVTEENVYKIS